MNQISERIVADLRTLIASLAKDGGLISPSVYDTAQLLRFYPPATGVEPALAWLLRQQQVDGGWGNPAGTLHARDVPTLAAILALYQYGQDAVAQQAIEAGLAFLQWQAGIWQEPLPEALPVGVELVLPHLIREAAALGLPAPQQQYVVLAPLGERKRQQIRRLQPGAATPPTFSWEAWGTESDPALLDGSGGVGHNPAATAYWLYLAAGRPELAEARAAAEEYLARAANATAVGIPGVVPSAWPIDRFEQIFVLHTLLVAGLLNEPALHDVVQPQLQQLASVMKPSGIGFSDFFVHDGDNTAAAVAVLKVSGYQVNSASMRQFQEANHFSGYPGEFQASHSVTARAVHTLSLFQKDVGRALSYIASQQNADGRWPGDKWNTSWLYCTCLAAFALKISGDEYCETLQSAIEVLQENQHADGGWGKSCAEGSRSNGISTTPDTAYGALALYLLQECGYVSPHVLEKAYQWLFRHYHPFDCDQEQSWLNKQEYSPYRIDWGFELGTMLALDGTISAWRQTQA